MSRYCNLPIKPILSAVEQWKQRCIVEQRSLFAEDRIWTAENLEALRQFFVERPDVGDSNFLAKLQSQLEGAPSEAIRLAAEIAWVMYLFPHGSMGAKIKRSNIERISLGSGVDLPNDHWALSLPVLAGIGSTGTFYNTGFWIEFSYAILVFRELFKLDTARRAELMHPEADFVGWLDGLPLLAKLPGGPNLKPGSRQFRHILLYLLQPDSFERISSTQQKREIVKTLGPQVGVTLELDTPAAIDRALQNIRRALEQRFGSDEVDFYQSEIKKLWTKEAPTDTKNVAGVAELHVEYRERGDIAFWLLGAYWDGNDRTDTFLREGRWENGYKDHFLERVKAVRAGDRVALKSTYTRKHNLPFDNRGESISCMDIKARGTVRENPGDGIHLSIEWESRLQPSTVYHFTYRQAIARINADKYGDVVSWIFDGIDQPLDRLRDGAMSRVDSPELVERFGIAPRNVILYGPPGTGKTWTLLEEILPNYVDDAAADSSVDVVRRYEMVTFHPSFSYEDFVEGLRPKKTSDGKVEICAVSGALKRLCERARDDAGSRYALIIDEINRGNIAKIFGELITLIEEDKRVRTDVTGKIRGVEVNLPYTHVPFGIPENVDVYGTMNTSDRSIALVDIALRRRFLFRELLPMPDVIEGDDGMGNIDSDDDGEPIDLRRLLRVINARLTVLRGRDARIGHAYFTKVDSFDALKNIFRDRIIPLLQEYFYEDWSGMAQVLSGVEGKCAFVSTFSPDIRGLFGAEDRIESGYADRAHYRVVDVRLLSSDAFRSLYASVPTAALEFE